MTPQKCPDCTAGDIRVAGTSLDLVVSCASCDGTGLLPSTRHRRFAVALFIGPGDPVRPPDRIIDPPITPDGTIHMLTENEAENRAAWHNQHPTRRAVVVEVDDELIFHPKPLPDPDAPPLGPDCTTCGHNDSRCARETRRRQAAEARHARHAHDVAGRALIRGFGRTLGTGR
jgi:hypothetical protein